MIYVYPDKPRGLIARYSMAPLVFFQVLFHHPKNGVRYAAYWARQSSRIIPGLPST